MIYVYWSVAGTIVLFVIFVIYDSINRAKARKLLPQILSRDWIDGRDLCKLLKTYEVSLSYASLCIMMKGENAIAEARTVRRIVDGELATIRQFRRRFDAPITSSRIGAAKT